MARHKDMNWILPDPRVETWEQAGIAVLMDIRDELKSLNAVLHCSNFTAIPFKLDRISRNTAKPREKKVKQK